MRGVRAAVALLAALQAVLVDAAACVDVERDATGSCADEGELQALLQGRTAPAARARARAAVAAPSAAAAAPTKRPAAALASTTARPSAASATVSAPGSGALAAGGSPLLDGRKRVAAALAVPALALLVGLALRACKARALRGAPAEGRLGGLGTLKAAVLAAALCHFCMSYNAGIVAGAWLYMRRDPELGHPGAWASGAVTSSLLLGAAAGALGSSTTDLIGRRLALLSVAGLYIVGAAIMAAAGSFGVLLLGRGVAGLGVGMSSVAVNVYISEIAPADCRGELGAWAPALGTFGILLSQVVSALLGSALPAGASWRCQVGLVALPSLAVILARGLLVESPRWLLLRGRREQALAAMAALFPEAPQEVVLGEIQAIEGDITSMKAVPQLTLAELCRRHTRPVAVGVGINVLQQVTGINVVIYFGPTVLEGLGLGAGAALLAAILVSSVQLCTVVLSSTLVDRLGRRRVAIIGMLAILCGHLLLVVSFAARSGGGRRWPAVAAVLGMLTFRAAFSFSLGPLPYIMTAELFPSEARAAGAALSWASNWGTNFLVCQSFPVVEERLAGLLGQDAGAACIFAFYLTCCLAALAVVLRALPETSGRQLERAMEEAAGPATARPAA